MSQYEVSIISKKFSEKDIINKIRLCTSYKDLRNIIEKNLFIITNLTPPFGDLGSKHLLKCFEIADYYSNYIFIPNVLGLREKVKSLLNFENISNGINTNSAIKFYKDKFERLSFTNEELKNIGDKLSLQNYCTLDVLAENTIVQLNAVNGIKTTSSCSGHNYSLRYFSASNLLLSVDETILDINKVLSEINSTLNHLNNNNVIINTFITENRINITFFQIPPKAWIKENKKKSISVLCKENLDILKNVFAYKSNTDLIDINSNVFNASTIDKIRKLIWEHVNALNTHFNISDDEDVNFWGIFRPRCLIFENEYQDFYVSESAIFNITNFWNILESLALSFRKYPNLLTK